MKNIFSAGIFVFIIVISGCTGESITPPELKPESYQEDIPWPSLADSPWPMYRHDPQGTHRSNCPGPVSGTIAWVNTEPMITGGLCVGNENNILLPSHYPFSIFSINALTGMTEWTYDLGTGGIDHHPCPVALKDSTIIATSGNTGKVVALDRQGKLIWQYQADAQIYNRGIAVSRDGQILFIDRNQNLTALDQKGKLKWKVNDTRFGYYSFETLTFSPDGKTIYFQGVNISLIAFDLETRSVKWTFGAKTIRTYPLVDSQGHIYMFTENPDRKNFASLYSLNPDGSVRWKNDQDNSHLDINGAYLSINRNGDIYFAYDTLYCIDYYGKRKFKKPLEHSTQTEILIDSNSNLYLLEDYALKTTALKMDPDGNILWTINNINYVPGPAGCITRNGQWIFSAWQYWPQVIAID